MDVEKGGTSGGQAQAQAMHSAGSRTAHSRLAFGAAQALAYLHLQLPTRHPAHSPTHTHPQPYTLNPVLLDFSPSTPGPGFYINTYLVMMSVYANIWVLLLLALTDSQVGGRWCWVCLGLIVRLFVCFFVCLCLLGLLAGCRVG